MVRLDSNRRPPNYLSRHQQWRLLALVLGLGLVILAMGELRRPEAVARLERVFSPAEPARVSEPISDARIEQILNRTDDPLPAGAFRTGNSSDADDEAFLAGVNRASLESIRDNTTFRSDETAAWFHLWQVLQSSTPAELITASKGEVDFVQLVEQPGAYRGQVVTVRGTAHRVEEVTPAKNDLGLDRLYLVTIRPPGGQIWPIRAYTLDLPRGFPRGDNLHAEVEITGIFFKNWSYEWSGGIGLAPVVMARGIRWLDPPMTTSGGGQDIPSLTVVTLGAVALAALIFVSYFRWNLRSSTSHETRPNPDEVARTMRKALEEGQA